MKYKVGQVVLFNWNGPFQKLIRFFNLLKYGEFGWAHSGIIGRVVNDQVYIYEAIERRGSDFKEYEYDKQWLNLKRESGEVLIREPRIFLKDVEKNCQKYSGSYYDWLSIILMPLRICYNSDKLVFCSEVVSKILYDSSNKELNLGAEFAKPYEKITPMDLYLSEQLATK